MTDTTVKYFHSGMTGAPTLSGTVGTVIAVLDACLVNGFGSLTADSVVVTSNVAVCTKSTGHSFEVGTVALMAGATPSGLNGEQKVTAVTSTTWSFATTGITDQTATGTITAKLAPAGWSKTYSTTNKGAYKPNDVTATACLLRVDDTFAKYCRVIGYETMSDIDTGTGLFPSTAQRSGGSYWSKSDAATSSTRNWMIVADGKMFYFAREFVSGSTNAHELHAFGDVIASKSGDAFSCILSGEVSDVSASGVNAGSNSYYNSVGASSSEMYMPRSYTGLGSSCQMRKAFPALISGTTSWVSGVLGSATPYPNPGDGGLYVVPHYVSENTGLNFRGVSPGFYGVPQAVANGNFSARDSVIGVTGMTGKTLKALTCQPSTYGVAFFDITGPWR